MVLIAASLGLQASEIMGLRIAGPRLLFRFLGSPQEIQAGPGGRIHSLTVSENILVREDGRVAAKATDETAKIDVDTVIFAIGDVHDATLGIPTGATMGRF